ncbi:MAG: SGNH/GDSL hydrolase family protein [Nitrospirae bacterium]|nr:SGNH/GDSL hydrolase family protein [Nitrospirota bacterium]
MFLSKFIVRSGKKMLFMLYLTVMVFILLEIAVRIWGYSKQYIYDPIYMPFEKTNEIPYVHKPNLKNARGQGLSIVNTDSLGLRSKTSGDQYGPKRSDEYRIAIVGDSVTFGVGIKRAEDTFPQVVEDLLNGKQQNYRVKVFNYAAAAYSVKEMALTLKYRMLDVQPDLVVMAMIPGDLLLSRTPSIDSWGYQSNYHLSAYVPRESIVKHMLRKLHLAYFLRDVYAEPCWMKRLSFKLINVRCGNKSAAESKIIVPESYNYIEQFRATAQENNLPYAVALMEIWGRKELWGGVPEQLDKDKIAYVDLTPVYNKLIGDDFPPEHLMASRFDRHPSSIVHQEIGKELADYILQKMPLNSNKKQLTAETKRHGGK